MPSKDLKFLVDVGVGKSVESWLRKQGYDVKCVREIDPRMKDEEILKLSAKERRMIITMDKDFGELVYSSKMSHAGVLILRLEEAKADEKVATVKEIVEKYSEKIWERFCVYKEGKLRIRK